VLNPAECSVGVFPPRNVCRFATAKHLFTSTFVAQTGGFSRSVVMKRAIRRDQSGSVTAFRYRGRSVTESRSALPCFRPEPAGTKAVRPTSAAKNAEQGRRKWVVRIPRERGVRGAARLKLSRIDGCR
jgi:hypothetical protein